MIFGRNIQNTVEESVHVSFFHVGLVFFIKVLSFQPDTENNASFDTVSPTLTPFKKRKQNVEVCMNVKVTTLGSL